MTYARFTSMTMLLVATVCLIDSSSLRAQEPATADSVAAADTTTKKKSRFGSIKDKAKAVAKNKAVQGAAKGVACTAVPLGAVSAATGTGPCANSGVIGSLMSGDAKAAAAAAAGGVAGNATAALAAKGGATGAAATGALGAMGGVTGLSNSAAQAAALQIMMTSGSTGLSNSAAQTAAMKLMQQNGMSDAVATAAMSRMMKAPRPAAPSAADAAQAMQMLHAMGMAPGGAAPTGAAAPAGGAAAAPAASAALWVNYDFVPGERVIYYADFTDDQVGNFPERLQFVEGNMEVAELGGRRVVRATSASKFSIPLPEVLPQRFTIEIDVINRPSLDGAGFHLRGSAGRVDDAKTSIIHWGSDGVALMGGGGGEVKLANNETSRLRYRGKPAQVRILGDGKYIKVYLDEKRVANVPNANFERSRILHLIVDARSEENPAFISRIRVAESRKSLYDDLAANGHVATQGLLFETGSDKLKPESAPTLKMIAAMIEQHADLRIRIEGHTDNVGNANANKSLSEKRAAAVKAALVGQYKVSGGRIDTKGLGDTKPAEANTTSEGRANNRRVELVKL